MSLLRTPHLTLFGIAVALLAGHSSYVLAATSDEVKAAADVWLSQERIKISYKSPRWTSVFETDMKNRTTQFTGSNDSFCFGNAIPTVVTLVENQLVFSFEAKAGCRKTQYRFDPITGAGQVLTGAGGSDVWTPSTSEVSLRR